MMRISAGCWALIALLVGAGCAKKTTPPAEKPATVTLVPQAERSRHFEAVNRHLDLGGTLYIYADIDGDADKLATSLRMIADNVSATQPGVGVFLKQDYRKLFATLGLDDIKALGLSSVPETTGGFRNRIFFYTPQGRHGLLAGLAGAPTPFIYAKMAPADVDWYNEAEIDVPAMFAAVKAVVAQVGGEAAANAMEAKLREAGRSSGFSALQLIQSFKGRSAMILCLDPKKNLTLPTPQPLTIPAFSLLLRVDGIGPSLEGALAKLPMLAKTQEGNMTQYAFRQPLPLAGLQPVFAVVGSAFYFATTPEFLNECLHRQSGLDQTPAFKAALAAVGPEGNGLSYMSPHFFARLRQVSELNPDARPEMKRVLALIAAQMPPLKEPLIAVRTNLPDGILVRSHLNRSLKQEVAVMAMYNPVTLGFMAAMAIPAFQKVRQASQEKAVLNNLRQLSAAADQYYLEHGVDRATYDDLVGPDKYIKKILPVAGEDYRQLRFEEGQPLRIRLRNGRVIQWPPYRR